MARLTWIDILLILIFVAGAVFLSYFSAMSALRAHEDLEAHPFIQDRYNCLTTKPEQTPEDLIYCDEWARARNEARR